MFKCGFFKKFNSEIDDFLKNQSDEDIRDLIELMQLEQCLLFFALIRRTDNIEERLRVLEYPKN